MISEYFIIFVYQLNRIDMKSLFNQIIRGPFTGLLIVLLLIAGTQSCKKDKETKVAPEMPPASTLVMDFNDYPNADTNGIRDIETYHNWWWAAINVNVWNTLIAVGLAVPVASFAEASNHEAVYNPDTDSWTWSYNFTVAGTIYLAELQASLVTDGVSWKMYISKENAFTDFLWYSGISNLTATQGSWLLYKSPQEPEELLEITWHRDPANSTADIKYMNVVPGGAENGGYIFYNITNDTPYNAFYDIYNKGQDNHTDIQWNRTTMEGQVKDPVHFGDAGWHCWDVTKVDIVCP
jgi:hypothetical protein